MAKAYALFDFDGTIIPGDSILRFCLYANARGLCTHRQLLGGLWAAVRYGLRLSTAEESKRKALAFLQGQPKAQMDILCQDFCREIITPRLRKPALDALATHRLEGADIILITASPSFYLEPLKQQLGLTHIIGTRMDVHPQGYYTGLIAGENCRGIQKPLRLAEYLAATGGRLDYDTSYAYGDTPGDVPMMELCAHKVAVNAGRKLRRKLAPQTGCTYVRWKP